MNSSGMWHLDVAVAPGAPAWDCSMGLGLWKSSTRHYLFMPPCTPLTIGRPGKNVNAQADLVINRDPSLSKIHVSIMRTEDNKLVITELSRFGSWVDGVKMQENVHLPLSNGSVIKLAGKVHLRVGFTPFLLLCSSPIGQVAQSSLATLGVHTSSSWSEGVTHLVTPSSSCRGSIDLLRAILNKIPIVNESWLTELVSLIDQKISTTFPSASSHCPSHVTCDGTNSLPILFSSLKPSHSLLSGLAFILVNGFSDPGIEWSIMSCGGRLLTMLPPSSHRDLHFDSSILSVSSAMAFSFIDPISNKSMAHMPSVEFLSALITGDKASITQRIMNARMLAEADVRSRAAAEMAVDDITDDPADVTPTPWAKAARMEGRAQPSAQHQSPSLSNAVLPSSPCSGGIPLSAERVPYAVSHQQALGPRGLGIGPIGYIGQNEGLFGPPPRITIPNIAHIIDQHQLRSFSTTHQQASAPPGPPPPGASSGEKQKGGKGKVTGKERPCPPPPPSFDAPPQKAKEPETVGPGHLIVYLPLQVDQSKTSDDKADEQSHGANFKIFRKGGSSAPMTKVLPMVVVEGRIARSEAGDTLLKAEMQRMEAKRKAADALFRGDDEGRVVEKRRKK
jgi:hypothetical protein